MAQQFILRRTLLGCCLHALACSILIASCALATAAATDERQFSWKPADRGQVKVDDKQPLKSAVYVPEKPPKKSNLALILLGHRWLALDINARRVYQVLPTDLQINGPGILSGDLFNSEKLVPSQGWSSRDVGPAQLIKLTLNDYGRQLQVFLPHPSDLRAFY